MGMNRQASSGWYGWGMEAFYAMRAAWRAEKPQQCCIIPARSNKLERNRQADHEQILGNKSNFRD
ncbi:hypothetical protein RB25_15035 [Herbaspirillum rubrisubalbicans]|uniref:Uncharacterized protein n=1 Tax=Herbaspirillum rubrisubalbicans TaxID=80842 RepID=A0ABX9BYJ9_9BURK|nr:hypothetical protein RB24_18720 [Herbaspirillum rubrisubalbicans]RAN46766.1 hypothetical protein RB25_15035 [Herbaspirillum rubrisubalbicans]